MNKEIEQLKRKTIEDFHKLKDFYRGEAMSKIDKLIYSKLSELEKAVREEVIRSLIKWAEENKLNISDFDSADLLKSSKLVEDAYTEIRIQNEVMDELIKYLQSQLKELN